MRYDFLRSSSKAMNRENSLQEQLSDGKAIHRPSDDPVKTVRSLRNHTNLSVNNQFTQNLQDAQSWMSSTDGAMSSLSSIMIKANELVISADDTKTPSDMHIISKQMDELINQMVTIGNSKVGDRYIFGGQNDSTQPFTRTTITDPHSNKQQDVVIYNGDSSKLSMIIQQGAVNPNQDSVNLTGADIFGPLTTVYGQQTVSVFSHLLEIKSELGKTATISQTNSAGGIGTVTGAYTGIGFASFDVKIDAVDASVAKKVTGASYSNDGGNTWMPVAAASLNSTGDPTVITLPDGVKCNITASAGNAEKDVYSFRVPQEAAQIIQSNTSGGAAVMTGIYTGTGVDNTAYGVRITNTNAAGEITGAEYSTDAGKSWTATTVTTGSPSSAIALSNGVILNVDTNVANDVGNTYSLKVLQGKGPDAKWLSNVGTNYVKDDHNMQLKEQTQLGTRMAMYQMRANMMGDQNLIIKTDLANNEDIDMTKAIVDYNTSQTVYKSALAVGAKIMSQSLIDFL